MSHRPDTRRDGRVLYVDGAEPADRVSSILEGETDRTTVVTATGASEGLAVFRDRDVDCIVSEYDLADADGLAFLEAVREDDPELPFILFTGSGSEAVAAEAVSSGATDYLRKDADGDAALVDSVRAAVEDTVRDDTEHEEWERELRHEHDQFVTLFENLPNPVVRGEIVDDRPIVEQVNRAFEERFGCDGDEIVGENLDDLTVPADRRDEAASLNERFVESGRLTTEVTRRTDDGLRDFVLEVVLQAEGDDAREGYAIYTDITEQKERERELRTRTRAMEEATDGIAIYEDGEYVHVNPAYAEIYGYDDPDRFLGETWKMCYEEDEIDRFDAEVYPEFLEAGSWRGEATGLRRDGSTFPQELSLTRIDEDRLVCVVRDITEHKERERRLRHQKDKIEALHATATDIEASETPAAVYETVVDAAESILAFDIAIADEAEGEILVPRAVSSDLEAEQYYDETPIDADDNLAARAYRTGEPSVVADLRTHDVAPADSVFRSAVTVPIGEHGAFQTVDRTTDAFDEADLELVELLVAHARAQLTQLDRERRLHERTEELRRQNERLDEFASIVSHDLRNPLNIAESYLELAREECNSTHLEDVDVAVERMSQIVEQTLTLARSGRTIDEKEPVDLASLAEQCWDGVDTVEADLRVEGLPTVSADPQRARHLFENLFRNAVEHGGADVTVRVGACEGGFYVEDDGAGFPDDADDLLGPTHSMGGEGAGIGLAIVNRIAEAHDWAVDVAESDDGGARFEIRGVAKPSANPHRRVALEYDDRESR